jgi:hypothetical protein
MLLIHLVHCTLIFGLLSGDTDAPGGSVSYPLASLISRPLAIFKS